MINTVGDVIVSQTPRRRVSLHNGNKRRVDELRVRGMRRMVRPTVTKKQSVSDMHTDQRLAGTVSQVQDNKTSIREVVKKAKRKMPIVPGLVGVEHKYVYRPLSQQFDSQGNPVQGMQHGGGPV
jgi:hypothetical protein